MQNIIDMSLFFLQNDTWKHVRSLQSRHFTIGKIKKVRWVPNFDLKLNVICGRNSRWCHYWIIILLNVRVIFWNSKKTKLNLQGTLFQVYPRCMKMSLNYYLYHSFSGIYAVNITFAGFFDLDLLSDHQFRRMVTKNTTQLTQKFNGLALTVMMCKWQFSINFH